MEVQTIARPARARSSSAWSHAHARRLLWRAGFGATPAELDHWASRGRQATIDWLVAGGRGPHGTRKMVGAAPRADGKALDPLNEWGHDRLWWLDRMVRSQRPLVERMTLLWHDHFATAGQDTPLMLDQNRMLRRGALGSFPDLLLGVTRDPAMQAFLSLVDSDKDEPNENYARELMELFTLGVDGGYTERDVREAARALTGFQGIWKEGQPLRTRYDPDAHDGGVKTILGQKGRWDYRDVLRIVVAQPAHAPYLVTKLWSYFVGDDGPSTATRRRLAQVYVRSGHRIAPVVREILASPALYRGLDRPAMVKWPVVHIAGMLRQTGRPVDTRAWSWLQEEMGQGLFDPPSVAGWDWGTAWMSTASMHARFVAATYMCSDAPVEVGKHDASVTWSSREHVAHARRATGDPWTSAATDAQLRRLAREFLAAGRTRDGQTPEYIARLTQAALRHLLLSGPDAQLC